MKNIDIKLIKDYLDGKTIDNIDELENDPEFMKNVILFSRDKKMYNFCSDGVKSNYSFVMFLIDKFSNDYDFLEMVVRNYVAYEFNEFNRLEIILKMKRLTENDERHLLIYQTLGKAIYSSHRLNCEFYKLSCKGEAKKSLDKIGLGFYFALDLYHSNQDILDFFAEEYICEIFNNNESEFTNLLHRSFDNVEDIKGMNNYIIDFVRSYDLFLADYLVCHINILDILTEKLNYIKKNWNYFIESMNARKVEYIYKSVEKYLEERDLCLYDVQEFIYYIGQELGIIDILKKCDNLTEDEFNSLINDMNLSNISLPFSKSEEYEEIKTIIVSTMSLKDPADLDCLSTSDCKIKMFKFNS